MDFQTQLNLTMAEGKACLLFNLEQESRLFLNSVNHRELVGGNF